MLSINLEQSRCLTDVPFPTKNGTNIILPLYPSCSSPRSTKTAFSFQIYDNIPLQLTQICLLDWLNTSMIKGQRKSPISPSM